MEKSEHIEFDVDPFLDSIPRTKVKQEPQCLRCLVDMKFGVIVHQDGSQFKYYSCPTTRFDTKCYVTSSKENLLPAEIHELLFKCSHKQVAADPIRK